MYMLFLHEAIWLVHEILIPRNNNTFLNGNDVFMYPAGLSLARSKF